MCPKPFVVFIAENAMRNPVLNLQRLLNKLQARYGEGDELVLELRRALAELEAKKAKKASALNQGRRKEDQHGSVHQRH